MRKGKIPKKLMRTAVGICVGAICLSTVGVTAAKYVSESLAGANTSVALFSPSLVSEGIDISSLTKPGEWEEHAFKVRNYTGEKASEVAMTYTIVVKTTGNLPLRFTVHDVYNDTSVVWTCDGVSGERTFESVTYTFSPNVKQEHGYTLRAEWPTEEKDEGFAGKVDAVYVAVEWVQVD